MSANGKVGIKGLDKFSEDIVSFRKDEDGTYTKVTKKVTRNRSTNQVTYHKKNNPVIETGPYKLVTCSEDFHEKQVYEDWNGEQAFLYFAKIEDNLS